jgi:hypothetical protein
MSGITYHWEGDYLIPDIAIEETQPLGKYGLMRKQYLKDHQHPVYTIMFCRGTLFRHCAEIEEAAHRRLDYLMNGFLEKDPPPDKAADQMGWVAHMNSLKARAEEIIQAELIYG